MSFLRALLLRLQRFTLGIVSKWRPFADIATPEMPLSRLLRLSLFQLTCGMVQTLFFGTLNRVMILELKLSATIVSVMIAIPLLVAPFRALIGFRSDTHRSVLGWKRVPFVWAGSMMQFAGLTIMPFALIVLGGDQHWGPRFIGYVGSGVAFFLVGAGAHTIQTAGLALASDIAPEAKRPRIIALIISLPLLTFLADMSALFGGMLVAWAYGDISPEVFMARLKSAIAFNTFMVGIIKAPFMALVIGVVACSEGLRVKGSAESLGLQTTTSVVKSIFLVIVLDGVFAIFFASIGM